MRALSDIHNEDLSSATEIGSLAIRAQLVGRAETASKPELDGYLEGLHDVATSSKISEVVIDLRALDFMNSTCFKAFVVWIGKLQDAAPQDQYRVRFLADVKKHWQGRSLAALACFAVDLVDLRSA